MTHLFPDLPDGLLQTLGELVPGFTLVGSFARDYWVHTIAGMVTESTARRLPGVADAQ